MRGSFLLIWPQVRFVMRQTEILCCHCVHPHALNYCQTRRRPPSYVHGMIADHRMQCTHCGETIEAGTGFVYVCGDRPIEGEIALHDQVCDAEKAHAA